MDCYSLLLEKRHERTFPYSAYKVYLKSLDIKYKTNVNMILNVEEKIDQLEVLVSKKLHRNK